jgi:hypothetical protein
VAVVETTEVVAEASMVEVVEDEEALMVVATEAGEAFEVTEEEVASVVTEEVAFEVTEEVASSAAVEGSKAPRSLGKTLLRSNICPVSNKTYQRRKQHSSARC